ncbi:MAG: porin [Spirosomataceae bacterium]|jgi:hypothetical protein
MKLKKLILSLIIMLSFSVLTFAQESGSLLNVDTTHLKKLISTYKKLEYVGFSGYIQPQFQIAQEKGIKSFNGGDFGSQVDNRFMLRRGRFRIDYARFNAENMPKLNFVFQFDGTERGFFIRDFWGRIYENKLNYFSIVTGMFARPMGFEINLSSSDRESLERGRMSQLLMKTERDLGAMISFEPKGQKDWRNHIKYDIGLFNGQGLAASADFDSHKDLISRLVLKNVKIHKMILSASISGLFGKIANPSGQEYRINENGKFSLNASDAIAPRTYKGADIQLKIPNKNKMFTELRAEYMSGLQPGLVSSTETPTSLPVLNGVATPFYVRNFNGAYFYFLQNFISPKNQLVVKYDWYDPNTKLAGKEITSELNDAEIKYKTLGLGYIRYVNENLKVVFYYDMPKNEFTSKESSKSDIKDNTLSCRIQYRF